MLAGATIGRLGITIGALPVVLPVNFRLVGERVVFRTAVGTKLDGATRNAVVAFEVDDIEPFAHAGWSVIVTDVAHEVTDPAELAALARANIPRWAPARADHIVEVPTTMVSGRRLVPGRPFDPLAMGRGLAPQPH